VGFAVYITASSQRYLLVNNRGRQLNKAANPALNRTLPLRAAPVSLVVSEFSSKERKNAD
jgi:hypothetical protein